MRSSGLFNNFHFGVFGVNECKSTDDGWYCNLSRFFSAMMMIIFILMIFSFIFQFLKQTFTGGSKSLKRSKRRSK